jgi:hypothetical protein
MFSMGEMTALPGRKFSHVDTTLNCFYLHFLLFGLTLIEKENPVLSTHRADKIGIAGFSVGNRDQNL